MQTIHTTFIKETADKTGKTYRELEALWTELTRDVDNDRMMNPSQYSHLRKLDGTLAEEVKRRFEKTLFNPEPEGEEPTEQPELQAEEGEFASEIEDNLENPTETKLPEEETPGNQEQTETEPTETNEENQSNEEILDDLFAEEV